MDWFTKAFIKASLVWLALGVTAGVAMAIHAPWVIYRPAHLHMNLLGFVAMMIFGVAYHIMPRLSVERRPRDVRGRVHPPSPLSREERLTDRRGWCAVRVRRVRVRLQPVADAGWRAHARATRDPAGADAPRVG